jgi:hypothetical protein
MNHEPSEKMIIPKTDIRLFAVTAFTAVLLSCSSDLFNPDKPPQIVGLILDRYEVDTGDTLTATVTVRDAKDKALVYGWTSDGGRFLPPSDQASARWKAPQAGGLYRITATVTEQDKKSASRSTEITVRSMVLPDVMILSPQAGAYLVQHDSLTVTARCRHDNGIERVRLFINGNPTGGDFRQTGAETYSLACLVTEPAGPAVLRVEAVARINHLAKSDSTAVTIEGVVPGKTGGR